MAFLCVRLKNVPITRPAFFREGCRLASISFQSDSLPFKVCLENVTAAKFAVTRGQERQGKRLGPEKSAAEARR